MPSQQDIPKEMRAARVNQKGQKHYSLETVPVPVPKAGQALLRTGGAGFCHTDLMVMHGELGGEKYPVTGSHEPVGTVVALGEALPAEDGRPPVDVRVGDRVVGFLHVDVCHTCKDCTEYDWRYCPNSKYAGINTDGGFAEYVLVDADKCVPIPENLSFQQAAPLTCAGITIYSAIKKCDLKKGEILAISGMGALGHLGVQIAQALGITVVGIDARPEPIEMARQSELAPDLLIDASKTSAEEAVKQIRKLRPEGYSGWDAPWDGADAFILTSDPKSSQKYGMDILRRHGLYVVVSQPPTVEFEFHNFVFKDIRVVGSMHGNKTQMKELIDLVGKHPIRSEVSEFKLDEHEQMVDSMHDAKRKGKAVMVFDA